jgi:transposase InsO family protein
MVMDHDCSKATIFIPCVEEISGEETATLYTKHVFARYGLPTKIISDRDLRFASKFTQELCKLLGIQQNISTVYHPRTDGQSERSNQWLEQYLRFWVNECQDDWAQYLPLAEFAHNNWTNKSTRESPFQVLMGYHPRADWTGTRSAIPQVTTCLEQYNEARCKAQELMRRVQQSWVRNRDTPKYQVGDQVWLEGHHLRTNQPTAKLAPKRHGPFKVIQVMSSVNYRLELSTQWSIHDVFHTDLLTPYHKMPTHSANYQRPPPDLIEGVEEYEVERVLDSCRYRRRRKLQYLVTWKGYPDSDNQWVNWDDAEGAQEAIREFKRSNPDREAHIKVVLLGLSRHFLLIFKYCTNRSEHLHGCRSHQKVVRASAKLKNLISRFRVIWLAKLSLAGLWLSRVLQAK